MSSERKDDKEKGNYSLVNRLVKSWICWYKEDPKNPCWETNTIMLFTCKTAYMDLGL